MDQNRDQWVATITRMLNTGFRSNMGIYLLSNLLSISQDGPCSLDLVVFVLLGSESLYRTDIEEDNVVSDFKVWHFTVKDPDKFWRKDKGRIGRPSAVLPYPSPKKRFFCVTDMKSR